ncbi:MAG: hypothetical protein QG650_793 [Patescibacteria group bacterium]|nr:hypothetical protein [Patescibacteria group bacterium]
MVSGGLVAHSSFAETDPVSGSWRPKSYVGTYGTNGFHLDFSDASSLTSGSNAGLGKDSSGNGNYWTTNNIVLTDSVLDSPTNNFATLNPMDIVAGESVSTFSNGSLSWNSASSVNGTYSARSTIAANSGKWYFETKVTTVGNTNDNLTVGIRTDDGQLRAMANRSLDIGYYKDGAYELVQNRNPPWVVGDVVGMAFDTDNDTVSFTLNGNPFLTKTAQGLVGKTWIPFVSNTVTNGRAGFATVSNFGQGGQSGLTYYSDAGGAFTHAPPTGFKALSTSKLPAPAIASPKSHFDILTWVGNSTASARTVSGLGFTPDFVWSKARSLAYNHQLYDSVRGVGKLLNSNIAGIEATNFLYGYLSSFNSDGF